jgi:hypothetical protein
MHHGDSAIKQRLEHPSASARYFNLFLSYSANFASGGNDPNPPGSGYHWSLQQIRFMMSDEFAKKANGRS